MHSWATHWNDLPLSWCSLLFHPPGWFLRNTATYLRKHTFKLAHYGPISKCCPERTFTAAISAIYSHSTDTFFSNLPFSGSSETSVSSQARPSYQIHLGPVYHIWRHTCLCSMTFRILYFVPLFTSHDVPAQPAQFTLASWRVHFTIDVSWNYIY